MMPGGGMADAAMVAAARSGDAEALEALVGAYLPLVYNIVGRALGNPAETDDVVQDVMLQMVRDLRQLRDPGAFRSWLVAITMRQVRGHWRRRRTMPIPAEHEALEYADPGADFVDLTIETLGLSDQRKEVALATRWLDDDDRQLLALWWLEAAGQLTRADLAAAMDVNTAQAAVLVHRAKSRLETARMVVRAVDVGPRCRGRDEVCATWDGWPSALWRKRIARHVRECPFCSAVQTDMIPAEGLLAGIRLLPVPVSLHALRFVGPGAKTAAGGHGAAFGHFLKSPMAWPVTGKVVATAVTSVVLLTGAIGISSLTGRTTPSAAATVPATSPASTSAVPPTTPAAPPTTASSPARTPSTSPTPTPKPVTTVVNTAFPIRAAFYYPWYPENFQPPGSKYTPSAGHYSVDSAATVDRQIKDMQYGGLQAGIESWWGQGLREDKRLPLLMTEAARLGFSWSVYYEKEGYGNPSVAEISGDLTYLRRYSDQPTWLHIAGRPVIFVWADGNDNCGMATRWAQANANAHYYVVLKVFGGYLKCADQPQGWHQYASGFDIQRGYSAIASPGFWRYDETTPTVPRDPVKFRQDVTTVAESKQPFQLIISYNEWGEGTAVESATAWASASGHGVYVDILHDVFTAHPR